MVPADLDQKKYLRFHNTAQNEKNSVANLILHMLKYVPHEATSDYRIPILPRMRFS